MKNNHILNTVPYRIVRYGFENAIKKKQPNKATTQIYAIL